MRTLHTLLAGAALAATLAALAPLTGQSRAFADTYPGASPGATSAQVVTPLCASGTRVAQQELYDGLGYDLGEIVRYRSNCGDGAEWETA